MNNEIKRYVIHLHTTPSGPHWDLMLEENEKLTTFRLPVPPEKISEHPEKALKIFDHDKKFLTYQGPVQNKTASVRIVDKGTCKSITSNTGLIILEITGKILNNTVELKNTGQDNWTIRIIGKQSRK